MIRVIAWVIMLAGGTAAGLYLDTILFENFRIGIFLHDLSFVIGSLLFYTVIRVSRNTGRTLARYGRRGSLKRMETNVLVTGGIYGEMRHPMHQGLLFFPLSIALLIGSPSFILIAAPIEMILMLIIIRFMEEPEAVKKFGKDYLDYKAAVPFLCFKIKCLRELLKTVPKL